MRTIRTIAEMRAYLARARARGRTVGLVPTMGAFHAGHHSLMRAARENQDEVVVSLFVNPAQFNDGADLAAYPRTEEQDAAEAADIGVDVLFAPPNSEIYPAGFATSVQVKGLSEMLEGAERGASHFAGVCTVVTKLLNIVQPDVAYFGQKDAQQLAVVSRMVKDLDIPVLIEAMPTIREPDGLALSSRNRRLNPTDRARALALHHALEAAQEAVAQGERDAVRVKTLAAAQLGGVDAEYLAIVDPDSFDELTTIDGRALVAVAARVGPVRLIDNVMLQMSPGGDPSRAPTSKGESRAHPPPRPAQPRDARQARRDPSARRADRDDHRLRPPERARGRAGGRRRRPRGRLGRPQRTRLSRHGAGERRGDADAHARRPPRPEDAAAGRRPALRVL